jgi:hypothetical protein
MWNIIKPTRLCLSGGGVRTISYLGALEVLKERGLLEKINEYLGNEYIVKASIGHVQDLDKNTMSIDIENNFKPNYIISPDKKKVVKESDWKTYYGSADEVKQWAKTTPTEKLTRVVLRLCKSSKELTYYETKYLFDYNVLADDKIWVNSNILGKFFPKDLASQE